MKGHYLLTIKANDRSGLLHLVTGMINRRLIQIESLTAARTHISDIVLITVELYVNERALTPLLLKLENIIEVFSVEAILMDKIVAIRSAFFKLDKVFLTSPQRTLLERHQAQIVNLYPSAVLIAKSGSDAELRKFYNDLKGSYLLGYSQTGLIGGSLLISEDQSSVINRLAA